MPVDASQMSLLEEPRIVPGRKLAGRVVMLGQTRDTESFATVAREVLPLTFEGIVGDRHGGKTRLSGGREPWYPRGTEMVNERQISLLSQEELEEVTRRMKLSGVAAEDMAGWVGTNVLVAGLPRFSMIPPRTRMVFEGGVVIRIDGDNSPCRFAGKSIADNLPEESLSSEELRTGLDLEFVKQAKRLRGLVGFIERPGDIRVGEAVTAMIPEQWIYSPE